MSKVKVIDRHSEKSIINERNFLSKLHHPFLANMHCSFQDSQNLYLVMDLLTGGDLRYHLCRLRKFTEDETKFFFSNLLLGLEYIHKNNIIHRDIKPENLVCDQNGYVHITDFGVAKVRKEDNSSETSGTPGYMAPEVLMGKNHSFPVDFFAIGIMGYEFIFGNRPYNGKTRKEIKKSVLAKQAKIEDEKIPNGWSKESVDFINKCLKRKDSKRIGFNFGVKELKEHTWFSDYNWEEIFKKKFIAPFIPKKEGNFDKKFCQSPEKINEETIERYRNYMKRKNFENIFQGYTYINKDIIPTNIGAGIIIDGITRFTTNSKQSKNVNSTNFTYNNSDRKYLQINKNINNELIKQKNMYKLQNFNNFFAGSPNNKNNKMNKIYTNDLISKEKEKKLQIDKNKDLIEIEKKIEKEENENKKDKKDIIKRTDKISYSISNFINNLQKNHNNNLKLDNKELFYNSKIEKSNITRNRFKNNESNNLSGLLSSNSIYSFIINNNNIKKLNSFNEFHKNSKNNSTDMSLTNLQNNISYKIFSQRRKKQNSSMAMIKMREINNFSNSSNKPKNSSFNNSNYNKIHFKLKNNIRINLAFPNPKNNNLQKRRKFLGIYDNYIKNNSQNKINNINLLKLKKIDDKNSSEDIPNYLSNLNKDLSSLNIYKFAKKKKLSLNHLRLKLGKINNNSNEKNNKNNIKYSLSPSSRNKNFLFKKSESTTNLLKNEKNININAIKINLHNNGKLNLNIFYSNLKRAKSNFGNKKGKDGQNNEKINDKKNYRNNSGII